MEHSRRERLELIFTLIPEGGQKTVIAETPRIEVGERRRGALTAIEMLETILSVLRALQLDEKFQVHGVSTQLTKLLTLARNNGRLGEIETSTLIFNYGAVANAELCHLIITEKVPGAAIDWERWASPFVASPYFVQGWVVDVEYDEWQNAEDPLLYTGEKRDYSSLPMRSNGLPPPLEQMVIDISNNPGRREFRLGYMEAVGSVMWLSELFWRYVGLDHKARLTDFSLATLMQVTDDVIRLSVSKASFTDESTRDLQDQLRDVLYN